MRKPGSKILHGLLMTTSGLVASTVIASTAAFAGGGPTGGSVAVGRASIVNASPTQTVVNQSSKKALINWNSFSIPAGSSVKFNQPTSKSLAVNRVTGPNASTVDGQLLANGNIWLINANGVLFGKASQVNVGALLATTSDISDSDFKNGNYTFQPASDPNAAVVNKGTIVVNGGGSVVLSAPHVSNEGLIQADLGTVVLGGAKAFTVDMDGDNLLRYEITAPVTDAPATANGVAAALVSNSGAIEAAGGHVTMTARAAQSVRDNVINNTGMVEANTVSVHNGEIDLDAGPDGTANVGGTLSASGNASGQTGGAVNVTGGSVNVADGAKIDVSGANGGGTVQIGGGLHGQGTLAHAQNVTVGNATIVADATTKGDGGTVAVWSDGQTSFAGSISAKGGAQGGNGGQVETSGHTLGVADSAKVDTSAPLGLTGDWLLDPTNFFLTSNTTQPTCCGSSSCVNVSTIMTSLGTTDVTEAADGTLTLDTDSDIVWNSTHSLTLLSAGDMTIGSNIQNAGTGDVTLVAGWDGTTTSFSPTMAQGVYGNGGLGDLHIDGAFIAIGSLGGQTIVAGHDVSVTADGGYAQIGYHGVGGSGSIATLATGDLTLQGGEGTTAIIGNGPVDSTTSGDVAGDIYVNVAGFTSANGTNSPVSIGNFAYTDSIETGDVTILTGGGDFSGSYFFNDLGGNDTGGGGDVFLGDTQSGNFTLSIGDYDSAHTLTWAVVGNATVTGDIANSGSGDVNIVAGWDGQTTDLAALTNMDVNAPTFGQGNGTVTVTVDNLDGYTSVGSAGGNTFVAGHAVTVDGFEGPAQIGYWGTGGGNIAVLSKTDVVVEAGSGSGDFAQIGNGGAFDQEETGNTGNTGNINVIALNDVSLTGGEGAGAYAQIGNGGGPVDEDGNPGLVGSASGDISIVAGGDVTVEGFNAELFGDDGYAQIGNGGELFSGPVSGNITITANGDVNVWGGTDGAYSQIGHGGADYEGAISGDISVTATNGHVDIEGGEEIDDDSAAEGYAQIGSGGYQAGGTIAGDIIIIAGNCIDLAGGDDFAYAQIGTGGEEAAGGAGSIGVTAGGDVTLTGGNGDFTYAQIGNGGENAGDSIGDISVTAGGDISLAGSFGYAQIGNGGKIVTDPTAAGNITIVAGGDLSLTGDEGDFAQIGNGADDFIGDVSGNISVNVAGTTIFATSTNDVWIGNFTQDGNESGDVSVITAGFNLDDDTTDTIGDFVSGDILGGNVTIGVTNGSSPYTIDTGATYTSPYSLTLLTAGDLDISGELQNNGSGNITLVAGWNPGVAPSNVLTTSGAYGNNDAVLTIGGVSCGTHNAAVGSFGGKTIILTDMLTVDSENGFAQVGYHGAGGGDIDVRALGLVTLIGDTSSASAQIGNGGTDVSGSITGNISVSTASQGVVADATADGAIAVIGNVGGTGSSQSGNITVNTNGSLLSLIAENFPGTAQAYATIGNFAKGDTTGTSSGNILINAGPVLLSASGGWSFAHIGNGDFHLGDNSGAISGNISINATTMALLATSDGVTADQARIGNFGSGAVSGNINVALTGDLTILGDGFGVSGIGGVSAPLDSNDDALPGVGSENITVHSGGAISLLAENGGSARIESGGLAGSISVTAAGNISVTSNSGPGSDSDGSYAIIGGIVSNGVVNVSVTSTGGAIDLEADDPGSTALIGNTATGAASFAGGNITVSAASTTNGGVTIAAHGSNATAQIGNSALGLSYPVSGNVHVAAGGNITVLADGLGSIANLGNMGGDGSSQSGDITVSAGGLLSLSALAGSSNAQIGNLEADSTLPANFGDASGNISVTAGSTSLLARGTEAAAQIGNGNTWFYNNDVSGDIILNTGDLTLTSNATTNSSSSFARIGHRGVGNETANITINAANVTLTGGPGGNAIIGHGSEDGHAAGDVRLTATGFVDLTAGGDFSQARIGHGGISGQGNLTVMAGGGVNISANGLDSNAHIANFGVGANSGDITITSANGNILLSASGTDALARIGLETDSASSTASGDVLVVAQSGSIDLSASGSGAQGQIGNGFGADSSVSGNVTVVAAQNIVVEASQSDANLLIGNIGSDNVTGDISVTAGGLISFDGISGSQTVIGNFATGSHGGDVIVTAQSIDGIGDSVFNDILGGDFTMNSLGGSTVAIDNAGIYSSPYNLTLNAGGDVLVESTLENSGTGNIVLSSAQTVTIGGSGATAGVALGSKSGLTAVSAGGDLVLTATNGFAQLGYNGGGSGIIVAASGGNITLTGGDGTGSYAQIGDGGYKTSGSSNVSIAVVAGGNITLNGGSGQEAYAQIGNGGAESNTGSTGYSETGVIVVNGQTVALNAGSGTGSYVQIGHGGYKSGQSLNGVATLNGSIAIAALRSVRLTGGGADAYAQLGNGGDFLNYRAANGSSGAISGGIVVAVSSPSGTGDPVMLTAGTGVDSYAQIGNGGQGENTPAAGAKVTFTISGDVLVSDLTLTGSNTGANGYAQLGNGDASKTGTGNISGNVTLGQGTKLVTIDGKAPGASADFGNVTGFGTVTGTVPSNGIDPGTIGSVASITQNTINTIGQFNITSGTLTTGASSFDFGSNASQGPSPLEQLADSSNSEGTEASDGVSKSVGQSLDGGKTIYVTSQTIIPGVLKQFVTLNANNPHGVPPADEDYSSWGNEALWRW